MPFYPNPFLPLHIIQRRIAPLGAQMHTFPERHILFGRSCNFQGTRGLPYVVADRRAVASPHRPAGCGGLGPDGGGVEMCLNLRRISPARLDRLPAGPMKRSCYLEGQDSSDQLDFQTPPHGLVHAEINIPHLVKQAAGGQLGDITLIVPQDSGDSVRIALGGRLDGSIGQELIAGVQVSAAYCLWYSYPFSSMIFRSCSNVLVRRYCTVERLRPSRLAISTSVIPSR